MPKPKEETCRYTDKPLTQCNCKRGCQPPLVTTDEWIQPVRKGYRMICCDCGLAHLLNFRLVKHGSGHKIQFQAFRD